MKVLHLISSNGFFGAENLLLELSQASQKIGADTTIGIFNNAHNSNLSIARKAAEYGVDNVIFTCRGRFDLKLISEIRKFVKERGIDIVHSHGYKSNFYNFFAVSRKDAKKVTTCHNWLGEEIKMRLYKSLDKFILKNFDMVIAVSEPLKKELIKSGISHEKVRLINNGINVERFKPVATGHRKQLKEEFRIKENEKVIGTISRLTREKGHNYLLRALKNVISAYPNIKLLIVGDGILRNSLELEVKSLELNDKVIFTGIRNDIPEILHIMDIFILPSLDEGMPMVLLEAMAAKKPIVSTRVGEITRMIENEYSGLLVEPGDSEALAGSLMRLLKDKNKADFLAKNGYDRALNNYSSEQMAKEYVKLYEDIDNNAKEACR